MTDSGTPQFNQQQWMEIAWSKDPPDLDESSREVLERYSKIPPAEVVDHVIRIREKGFKIFPYPCIGQWRFMNLAIGKHPKYQDVLRRMLTGEQILLDLGCAFAQDIRRLVADGVDGSKCYGTDLRLQFLDLGYELFRDKETLKANFIQADVFIDDSPLAALYGKVDIINASSFFHLFSREDQVKVARRCIKLWNGKPGNLLVGRQVGNDKPAEHVSQFGGSRVYRHNSETWQELWNEVAAESGMKFRTESDLNSRFAGMESVGKIFGEEESTKMLVFSVERIE